MRRPAQSRREGARNNHGREAVRQAFCWHRSQLQAGRPTIELECSEKQTNGSSIRRMSEQPGWQLAICDVSPLPPQFREIRQLHIAGEIPLLAGCQQGCLPLLILREAGQFQITFDPLHNTQGEIVLCRAPWYKSSGNFSIAI